MEDEDMQRVQGQVQALTQALIEVLCVQPALHAHVHGYLECLAAAALASGTREAHVQGLLYVADAIGSARSDPGRPPSAPRPARRGGGRTPGSGPVED